MIKLIADDHPIVRGGVKELLVRHLEGAVCGEAENARQVLAQVQRLLSILEAKSNGMRHEKSGGGGGS